MRICLESQSAIKTLARGPADQVGYLETTVSNELEKLHKNVAVAITIQCVPVHAGVDEQEDADTVAKVAAPVKIVTVGRQTHLWTFRSFGQAWPSCSSLSALRSSPARK